MKIKILKKDQRIVNFEDTLSLDASVFEASEWINCILNKIDKKDKELLQDTNDIRELMDRINTLVGSFCGVVGSD